MKDIVAGLIKKWGVKLVLKELISVLNNSNDDSLNKLAKELQTALDKWERGEQSLKLGDLKK